MFAQMKRSYRAPDSPCPCNNTCRCHQPQTESRLPTLLMIILLLAFVIGMPIAFAFLYDAHPYPVHYIPYKGRDCTFIDHVDECTSGVCYHYDSVLCPTE
jgi:hypothetical protein